MDSQPQTHEPRGSPRIMFNMKASELKEMIAVKYLKVNGKHHMWTFIPDWHETEAIRLTPCDGPELNSKLHGHTTVTVKRDGALLSQIDIFKMVVTLNEVDEILAGDFKPPWLAIALRARDLDCATSGDLEEDRELGLLDIASEVLNDSLPSVEEFAHATLLIGHLTEKLSGNSEGKISWMRQHLFDQGLSKEAVDRIVKDNQTSASSDMAYGSYLICQSEGLQKAWADCFNPPRTTVCTEQYCEDCSFLDRGYCRSNTAQTMDSVIEMMLKAQGLLLPEYDSTVCGTL